MPSPFPGMDPYLEGELWPEFHDCLAHRIADQLTPRLTPKYMPILARRYVMTQPAPASYNLPKGTRLMANPNARNPLGEALQGGGNNLEFTEPSVELPSPLPEEIPLVSLEIRDRDDYHLVTVIEILSPVNKHSDGVVSYGRRRTALLRTSVHLLEIDLLRHGERVELLGEPPPAPYYVYLSRVQRRPFTQIWPISLRQPLPVVPVPLLPPDPDVPLDLQAALRGCFELENYDRLLNYDLPLPNLSEEEAAWVAEFLKQRKG